MTAIEPSPDKLKIDGYEFNVGNEFSRQSQSVQFFFISALRKFLQNQKEQVIEDFLSSFPPMESKNIFIAIQNNVVE
jgi:hypothetical protein